jgi:hypothetical protein
MNRPAALKNSLVQLSAVPPGRIEIESKEETMKRGQSSPESGLKPTMRALLSNGTG